MRAETIPRIPIFTILITLLCAITISLLLTLPTPQYAIIFPSGILLLIIFMKRPSLAYYLLLFTIPFYNYRTLSQRWELLKIDFVIAVVLMAYIIVRLVIERRFPDELKAKVWFWWGAFLFINTICALLSSFPGASINGMRLLLMATVYIALNLLFIRDKDFRIGIPIIVCGSVAIAALLTVVGYIFQIEALSSELGPFRRGMGPTIGANNMALMCIYTIPIILHFFIYSKTPGSKILLLLLLSCVLSGLISTFSRGGFLNMTFVTFLILLTYSRRLEPRNLGIFVGALMIAILVAGSLIPGEYTRHLATIKRGARADTSTARRAAYLRVGWRSFKKHPLFGTGPLTFPEVWVRSPESAAFKHERRPAHNTYMDVLVGSGLLGLAALLALLAKVNINFIHARRICREKGDDWLVSLITAYHISFASVIFYFLFKSGLQHKFFLLSIALSELAIRVAKKEEASGE